MLNVRQYETNVDYLFYPFHSALSPILFYHLSFSLLFRKRFISYIGNHDTQNPTVDDKER